MIELLISRRSLSEKPLVDEQIGRFSVNVQQMALKTQVLLENTVATMCRKCVFPFSQVTSLYRDSINEVKVVTAV